MINYKSLGRVTIEHVRTLQNCVMVNWLALLCAIAIGSTALGFALSPETTPGPAGPEGPRGEQGMRGAPGGTTNVFIFRPGGTAGGIVYTNETALSESAAGVNNPMIIFDLSLVSENTYTFVTAGQLDFGIDGVWTTGNLAVGRLQFVYNTTFAYPPGIVRGDLGLYMQQAVTVFRPTTTGSMTLQTFAYIENQGAGNLISVASTRFELIMEDWTVIFWDGTSTGVTLYAESGSEAFIIATDGAQINQNALSTTAPGAGYIVLAGADVYVDPSLLGKTIMPGGGLYTDYYGNALTLFPPANAPYNTLLFSNEILWYSLGTAWIPITPQAARTTLANGVSPYVSVTSLTSTSRIVCTHAALHASTALGTLFVNETARTNGMPGSFVVTSLSPSLLSIQSGDQSDVDCIVL